MTPIYPFIYSYHGLEQSMAHQDEVGLSSSLCVTAEGGSNDKIYETKKKAMAFQLERMGLGIKSTRVTGLESQTSVFVYWFIFDFTKVLGIQTQVMMLA
ncbi:hypothetical protein STEG23_033754, partial [Scotinomys teguina]